MKDQFGRSPAIYRTKERSHIARGLIINNFRFDDPDMLRDRNGTQQDETSLVSALRKRGVLIDTIFDVYHDQSADEMRSIISKYASPGVIHMSAFVCCILTHGERDLLYGRDGDAIHIWRDLVQVMGRCKELANKPKLFLLQACQSIDYQSCVDFWHPDLFEDHKTEASQLADVVVALPAPPGFKALRDPQKGSLLVQTFCNVLNQAGDVLNILEVLINVNRITAAKARLDVQPIFHCTLRYDFFLRQSEITSSKKEQSMMKAGSAFTLCSSRSRLRQQEKQITRSSRSSATDLTLDEMALLAIDRADAVHQLKMSHLQTMGTRSIATDTSASIMQNEATQTLEQDAVDGFNDNRRRSSLASSSGAYPSREISCIRAANYVEAIQTDAEGKLSKVLSICGYPKRSGIKVLILQRLGNSWIESPVKIRCSQLFNLEAEPVLAELYTGDDSTFILATETAKGPRHFFRIAYDTGSVQSHISVPNGWKPHYDPFAKWLWVTCLMEDRVRRYQWPTLGPPKHDPHQILIGKVRLPITVKASKRFLAVVDVSDYTVHLLARTGRSGLQPLNVLHQARSPDFTLPVCGITKINHEEVVFVTMRDAENVIVVDKKGQRLRQHCLPHLLTNSNYTGILRKSWTYMLQDNKGNVFFLERPHTGRSYTCIYGPEIFIKLLNSLHADITLSEDMDGTYVENHVENS